MEGKKQKAALEPKLFKIPIEYYEKDMDTESAKGKKNEIIDLLKNYNKLSSEEEFNEIRENLYEICRDGDVDLIKIYLSETIQNDTKELAFKIDQTNHTASLFKIRNDLNEVVVPRTVKHDSIEYLITSICGTSKYIETLKFVDDSAVKTIYGYVFPSCSYIAEIHFPEKLTELKKGWCFLTQSLNEITISPSNGQFMVKDGKYLLGKSDSNKDEFDTLFLVKRDIKEISVPSNIKVISPFALQCCYVLTKVEFPTNSNLQSIGEFAFSDTGIKEIVIPATVLKICEGAFANCFDLSEVKIQSDSKLHTIESGTFSNTKVAEIYFPDNLKHLKKGWCSDTKHLTKITISPSNGQFMMKDDNCLVGKSDTNKDEFDIIHFACRDIEKISIPSNIKSISSYAFSDCTKLTEVEISKESNLQTIEEYAFKDSKIKEIFIPSTVMKVCKGAFSDCSNLSKVDIPENSNLQTIGANAFYSTNIKEISIPSKVSKISHGAFANCIHLEKVDIRSDSNLQTIGSGVFYDTKIQEIYFPASLKELEDEWCFSLNKLNKITISPSNGQFIMKEDKYLVGKSDPSKDEFDILLFAYRDIEEISIPSNIKVISPYAFHKCFKLAKVEIPADSNLQTIGKYAFNLTKIKEIRIPSKVSKICEFAFSDCEKLAKVEIQPDSNLQEIEKDVFQSTRIGEIFIPPKVSKISSSSFSNCTNLTKVEIPPDSNLQTIDEYAFMFTRIKEIHLPANLRELKEGWCSDTRYLNSLTVSPLNGQFMVKENKYLVGKSDLSTNEFDTLFFVGREIKKILIPSNIKVISPYAFGQCLSLRKVEIPADSNLQIIEEYAFEESGINEIRIPSKVVKIGGFAFSKCSNLVKIDIPINSDLQIIDSSAFDSTKIKDFFITSNVLKICNDVFNSCNDLQIVELSEESKLEEFPLSSINECTETIIMIPSSLKRLFHGIK